MTSKAIEVSSVIVWVPHNLVLHRLCRRPKNSCSSSAGIEIGFLIDAAVVSRFRCLPYFSNWSTPFFLLFLVPTESSRVDGVGVVVRRHS